MSGAREAGGAREGRRSEVRILVIGDLVGTPGLRIVRERLEEVRAHLRPDLVVANVENVAGGSGITRALGRDILAAGVDLMTLGDHAYGKRDQLGYIDKEQRLIRPYNYPARAAGRGMAFFDLPSGDSVALFQLQGRVFLQAATDCPFMTSERAVDEARARARVVLCDIHAEATSEKIALGWHLDGRISALFGTHTHVQTADERILPGGTAYISDLGMTGPYDSVIGRSKEPVLQRFITNVPAFFSVATEDIRMSGAFLTVDASSGQATSIRRFHLALGGDVEDALGGSPSHGGG